MGLRRKLLSPTLMTNRGENFWGGRLLMYQLPQPVR